MRRKVGVLGAVLGMGLAIQVAVPTWGAPGGGGSSSSSSSTVVTRPADVVELSSSVTGNAGGGSLTVGPVTTVETVHWTDGSTTTTETQGTTNQDPSLQDCLYSGSSSNVTQYPAIPLAGSGRTGHVLYVFFPYEMKDARLVENHYTRQWELCSKGGGQSDLDPWKLDYVGGAQANTTQTRISKIGWNWKTGSTPPSYTLTHGFAVGTSVCIKYNDVFWKNNVTGWWDGQAVGGDAANRWHGTVVQGLWEYPMNDPEGQVVEYSLNVYEQTHCDGSFWNGMVPCYILDPQP
ncbi:MAG: hypothetical protein HY775_02200 [Acidobacteria bacterium]|nr:hypothetical protein [Acidobacteriota bacterium]